MIFPGDSGYLKWVTALCHTASVEVTRLLNLLHRHITDQICQSWVNHDIKQQGTAYAGVTAQLWGNSSRPVFMKSVLMVALICSMRRKIP